MILTAQSLPNNTLAHHGILGMKWGRKNGLLTSLIQTVKMIIRNMAYPINKRKLSR